MAYELFKREEHFLRKGLEPTIRVTQDRFMLNIAAGQLMKTAGVEFVNLLWDKGRKRVALRATKKADSDAFRVRFHKTYAGVSAATFLRYIGWKPGHITVPAEWDAAEKTLEIALPEGRIGVGTEKVDRVHGMPFQRPPGPRSVRRTK